MSYTFDSCLRNLEQPTDDHLGLETNIQEGAAKDEQPGAQAPPMQDQQPLQLSQDNRITQDQSSPYMCSLPWPRRKSCTINAM